MVCIFISISLVYLLLDIANLRIGSVHSFLIGIVAITFYISVVSYAEVCQSGNLVNKSLSVGNFLCGCIVCTKRSGGVSGVCLDKTINFSLGILIIGADFVGYGMIGIKSILGSSDDSLTLGDNCIVRFCEIVRSLVIAIVRQCVCSFLCIPKSLILSFQFCNDTCVSIVVGDDWLCFLI